MQLIIIYIAFFVLFFIQDVKTQVRIPWFGKGNGLNKNKKVGPYMQVYERTDWKIINIDFLSSY